ncbi:MAG: chemotaxis response regulator protein-glutamate methylesterase [bacterium]|nr:chemotaxis response regulator protein-glutamate methylesterase [bacterium]
MSDKIRVLVVDDSLVAREMIITILSSDKDIEIVGQAKNGIEAVEMTERLRPDLITMDIHMPHMNGLEAIGQIMAYFPTPILVVTASVIKEDMDLTFESLRAGALDVVEKPAPENWMGISSIGKDLIKRVKLLSQIEVITHLKGRKRPSTLPPKITKEGVKFKVIGMAASTGGPSALLEILSSLPEDFPGCITIVQHIADGFTQGLVEWLDRESKIRVKEAKEGDRLDPGTALIAPNRFHMLVSEEGRIELNKKPPVFGHRPSADVLLPSVASVFRDRSIGVILTGMGKDGAEGLKAIKEKGGVTISQSEETCVVFGMPKAAIDLKVVDRILPIDRISQEITKECLS